MDINFLRSIATFLLMLGFIGLCALLIYSSKRKQGYEEAANLPFADDDTANEEESNK